MSSTLKKINPKVQRSEAKLPWWVELLFVQIGLPDIWLRNILKFKKSSKYLLSRNKSNIYYSIIILTSLIYIYPLVKSAKINNECIQETTRVYSQNDMKTNINNKLKRSAVNYCNGGNSTKD